jgi:phosphatidylserine decarboxylase
LNCNELESHFPDTKKETSFSVSLYRETEYCHRSLQNQPVGVDSKPATLRQGIHIISVFSVKGFSFRVRTSRGRAASLSSRPRRWPVRLISCFSWFPG